MMSSTPLTSGQRKKLKSLAHHLEPVVRVGKGAVSDALLAEVSRALASHELIKVKFVDSKEQRVELSEEIARATSSYLVDTIGNNAIFYRQHDDKDKRQISL